MLPTAAALAIAASPAYAANGSAPGAVKKDAAVEAPVAPALTAPAPAAKLPDAPKAHGKSQPTTTTPADTGAVTGQAPVTKGTVKKLQRTQVQASAPAATTHTARSTTRPTARRTAAARRHRTSGAARTRNSSKHHGLAAREPAATQAGTPVPSADSAGGAATVRRATSAGKRTGPVGVATGNGGTDAADPDALTSVTRAADRVVEVIPGVLVLALAGLAALVVVLVVRSWLMDRRRVKALESSYGVTVEALATAIEAKDHTTGGHIERVRRLGLLLASEAAPREARNPQMAYGFLLHDIGKLAVPDAILRAPGRLTEDEWALMRRHPDEGARMLAEIPFLDRALDVVRYHHERWDGGGYPEGLAGEEIPLWARIFSVADALDAITAERPYRPGRSYESALEEIRAHAGTQFDPDVVLALERIDKARIEPLLEPTQQLEAIPEPEVATLAELGPPIAV